MNGLALVTGGSGFIGSSLISSLLAEGWDVRTCGRRPRPPSLPEAVDYVTADLTSDDNLQSLCEGADCVFHLAGLSSSFGSQEEVYRSNVSGTENLLGGALAAGVERFLYMSSSSVYGEEVPLPQPVVEDAEAHPSRGYGKAKWEAEQAVWRFAEKGLAAVVVRPVTVFGPGNIKLLASSILDAAIERFAGAATLQVHREPVELRLLHLSDLVRACLHLVQREQWAGRAYNLTLDTYPSSIEIAQILAHHLELELELHQDSECGLSFEEREQVRDRMLSEGMRDDILLTEKRLKALAKSNRNNRLSVEALLATGFRFEQTDLHASIGENIDWYRRHRWIL